MKRTTIKVAGESGMGLLSVGTILTKTLKDMGFYMNMDREYPSLIKGGHSNLQVDFSFKPVNCLSEEIDIVMALDKAGLEHYVKKVKRGGILVHGYERRELLKDLEAQAKRRKVTLMYMPARQISYSFGGNELVSNMVTLGLLWRVLGFDLKLLENSVKEQFADKPKWLAIDLKCVRAGYKAEGLEVPEMNIELPKNKDTAGSKAILVDGNLSIALGAIQCGVRAYYAYPMSPSSSILTHLANFAHETGMVVKQAEDEITAVQMGIGSMHAGTRALVGTSGGGFDLMTETVSLSGITETPLVVVIAQRPGPGTGLPTWTGQGDLNLAVYSAHGEFTRLVVAASDPTSCYELIQHAMNYAEEFQIPVIFLTEKVICETKMAVPKFGHKKIPIKRGLVTGKALEKVKSTDRFKFTPSGVSDRWVPCSTDTFYFANGDEHLEDGRLTEEAGPAGKMYGKRVKKLKALEKALPEPQIYSFSEREGKVVEVGNGHASARLADISFVGWGSTKGTMLDVIEHCKENGIKVNYLHYDYVYPLKVKKLKKFISENSNVCLIEGNYFGQLGELIKAKLQEEQVCFNFAQRFLKYDGRPFFFEETIEFVMKHQIGSSKKTAKK